MLSLAFFTLFNGLLHAQQLEVTKDRTGRKLLKGFVSDSLLRADSASFTWFLEHEKAYVPAPKIVGSFRQQKDSVTFMIFMGTWCADSHYVIPRFFKIAELAGVPSDKMTMFALDRTKKDAAHFATNFSIAHVPTIIILKNGKEAGRVVEYGPQGRFDEALAAILDQLH